MEIWQKTFLYLFGAASFSLFIKSYYECRVKKNTHGSFLPLNIIGAFVWADAVIFGLFWTLVSLVSLYLGDWILFCLTFFVFWGVRSFGEIIYWLNQQYSDKNRNPIERYPLLLKIFHNDSIWFVYQIYWQCVMVVSIIASVYLANRWIERL